MEFHHKFPTLRDMATRAIAHCLIKLYDDEDNKYFVSRFHACREQLERLDLSPNLKYRIAEALNCTDDCVADLGEASGEPMGTRYHRNPKFLFNVHGFIDERAMARRLLDECYRDPRYGQDGEALRSLLKLACNYTWLNDITVILCKILAFRAKELWAPRLMRPDITDRNGKLCLQYRFVDIRGMRSSLTVRDFNYNDDQFIEMKIWRGGFSITLKDVYYDSELLKIHLYLIPLSKRLDFVIKLLEDKATLRQFRQFVDILKFLDPQMRQHYLTQKFESSRHCFEAMRCLLMWPFQAFFVPTLKLTISNLSLTHVLDLFIISIDKLDMDAFEETVVLFWNEIGLTSKGKSRYFKCTTRAEYEKVKRCYWRLASKHPLLHEELFRDFKFPEELSQDFELPDSSKIKFEPKFKDELGGSSTSFKDDC